jgi:hypothetical protein
MQSHNCQKRVPYYEVSVGLAEPFASQRTFSSGHRDYSSKCCPVQCPGVSFAGVWVQSSGGLSPRISQLDESGARVLMRRVSVANLSVGPVGLATRHHDKLKSVLDLDSLLRQAM